MDIQLRTRQLHQIPVFALRQMIYPLIAEKEQDIRRRIKVELNRQPRVLKRAVQRYTREQLVKLINACPEIRDEEVVSVFEEFRYGVNPSFNIFLISPGPLLQDKRGSLVDLRGRFDAALTDFNEMREDDLARIRRLTLNDLVQLQTLDRILEGNYRFQKRLDFIDDEQNAVSIYETLYGFFWLNTTAGYAIIHARNRDVLSGLRDAIENAVGIRLSALVITKHLKNKLPFLFEDSLRSSRLHDPDPDLDTFRWMSITDDNPYDKGYRDLEAKYPEIRSLRYQEIVDEEGGKMTSLTLRCDQGALSLAGRFTASQFRAWCLLRLGQIITVLQALKSNPAAFVNARKFVDVPEMAKLATNTRREIVREIIGKILSLKYQPGIGYLQMSQSPLALAVSLDRFVRIQVPVECGEPGCGFDGYIACPICQTKSLAVVQARDNWQLRCNQHIGNRWRCNLPLAGTCEQEHPFELGAKDLAEMIELIPSDDLLQLIADVIKRYLPEYEFNPDRESFIIRGQNLMYAERPLPPETAKVNIEKLIQNVNTIMPGGKLTGVEYQPG